MTLGKGFANETQRLTVTLSLIGWVHTKHDHSKETLFTLDLLTRESTPRMLSEDTAFDLLWKYMKTSCTNTYNSYFFLISYNHLSIQLPFLHFWAADKVMAIPALCFCVLSQSKKIKENSVTCHRILITFAIDN